MSEQRTTDQGKAAAPGTASAETQASERVPLAEVDSVTRALFQGFALPVFKAMTTAPQRTRAIAEAARVSREMAKWTLDGMASVQLVSCRGDWWRLTEWGQRALAGEEPPPSWNARTRQDHADTTTPNPAGTRSVEADRP